MKKIRKAVFPVAGLGTRFLPATKAMPKELLPIIDKPLIQYAAEEAISAGVDTLIFVTGRNKRAIEDHFDLNLELERALIEGGNLEKAEMLRNILPKNVECIYTRQSEQLGLGHAILCAKKVVGTDPFCVILADDFITGKDINVTNDLISQFHNSGKMQVATIEVENQEISKYGVLKFNQNNEVIGLVEKPKKQEAPSKQASIGRYVLTHDIFDILNELPMGYNREIQLADGLNIAAEQGRVESLETNGKRFDCGSKEGYLNAIFYMAKYSDN